MNHSVKKFPNGLQLVTVPMKDNQTVTVMILVNTGSKYETKKNNGISHFLEHMCFKGTVRRPDAHTIASELDALGAQYNAFTGQEITGYHAKAQAKDFGKIFDVLADIYLHSTFPEIEMEKEKGVIIEEINMYEDMPQRQVQEVLMQVLYGNQPAGWSVAGPRENITKMKRDDFVQYKTAHYVPRATTIVVSGNIDQKLVEKEVAKVFGSIKKVPKSDKLAIVEKQSKPALKVQYKKTDQTHISFGFRSFDVQDKRNTALNVLTTILGGGMSSRLFMRLREELGVAYYVRSGTDSFSDHGYVEISAGVTNARTQEVIQEILRACTKLKEELVDAKELEKAKEIIIGNLKLGLESSDSWAMYFAGEVIQQKKVRDIADIEKAIRKINPKDIQNIAQEIFVKKHLNLAIIGPFEQKDIDPKILVV